jgi:hypothetical protein
MLLSGRTHEVQLDHLAILADDAHITVLFPPESDSALRGGCRRAKDGRPEKVIPMKNPAPERIAAPRAPPLLARPEKIHSPPTVFRTNQTPALRGEGTTNSVTLP